MGLGNNLEKTLIFKQKVEEKEPSKQTEKNQHVRKRIYVVREAKEGENFKNKQAEEFTFH